MSCPCPASLAALLAEDQTVQTWPGEAGRWARAFSMGAPCLHPKHESKLRECQKLTTDIMFFHDKLPGASEAKASDERRSSAKQEGVVFTFSPSSASL